jgi:hypothetical protein
MKAKIDDSSMSKPRKRWFKSKLQGTQTEDKGKERRKKGFFGLWNRGGGAIDPLKNSDYKNAILNVFAVVRVREGCDHNCISRGGMVLFWSESKAECYQRMHGCEYTVIALRVF